MIRKTISHYGILEKLGEGGMGEVYLAEDTKLKRKVALKFLHKELTREEDAKQRFIQEARAAARLDHVNICSVYEIDETEDGQLFIAMGYYEGQTLKDKISGVGANGGSPLPINQAIDIAIQIAEGLNTAHEKNIVHRDIKSANIIITDEGIVKILDFGLAKLKGQTRLTKDGTTLGTVAYMSPEQAAGEKADHRADIWSLGVVFYEMVAGQLPFKGEYEQAVLYAIMNEESAPLTSVRTNVPVRLEEITNKLLSKDPNLRYQHIDELPVDLKHIDLKARPPATQSSKKVPFWQKPYPWQIIAILALMIAVVAVWYPESSPNTTLPINSLKITTATGLEDYPSWSPEGKRVAFHSNQAGNYDIWVTQVNGGRPQNRTADYSGDDRFPVWSHNGDFVAFWSERLGGSYYVMPALGGSPARVVTKRRPFSGSAQWSADDAKLACVVKDARENFFIEIVNHETGRVEEEIKVPSRDNIFDLTWSMNGQFFAYVDAPDRSWDASQIFMLSISDKKSTALTDGMTNNWNPSWSRDSRSLYYVSNRKGGMDLWRQKIKDSGHPKGPPIRITAAVGMRSAAWSPDGMRLAFSKGKSVNNVWSVPKIEKGMVTDKDVRQVTFFQANVILTDISRDGEWIYVSSDIKGNYDIWKMAVGGGDPVQLTRHPAPDFHPRLSPDGKQVVFYSTRSGNRDIWILPDDGGPAKQVTDNPASDFWSDWAADSQEILFTSSRGGNYDIWKKSLKDNSIVQLTSHPADDVHPRYSPDGFIYFRSYRNGVSSLWKIHINGGGAEEVFSKNVRLFNYSKQSDNIYFSTTLDGQRNIWRFSPKTGLEMKLSNFGNKSFNTVHGNVLTIPDKEKLFFYAGKDIGDLYVMDFEKE